MVWKRNKRTSQIKMKTKYSRLEGGERQEQENRWKKEHRINTEGMTSNVKSRMFEFV